MKSKMRQVLTHRNEHFLCEIVYMAIERKLLTDENNRTPEKREIYAFFI